MSQAPFDQVFAVSVSSHAPKGPRLIFPTIIQFPVVQPDTAALAAAVESKPLKCITLQIAGALRAMSLRFKLVDLTQLPAQSIQKFPISLGEIDVFFGSQRVASFPRIDPFHSP
jgi:hypothetical protein